MTENYGIAPDEYRLPVDMRLGTVTLRVSDLDRSLEFYEGLLGMRVIEHSHHAALLGADGSDEPLLTLRAGGVRRASRRGRLGLYHFAVLLPDRPSLGRLLAHLVRAGAYPGAADHLVSEALYLQDPDDLGIELYRDRPRDEWKAQNRQLVMATDPLDTERIIAAAAGEPWTGMPRGTTIGHVHLHVGNIDAARSYYHDALGLDVVVWSYPGALFMSAGGYHHHLGVNTWAGAHAQSPQEDEPQLISWEMVLPTGSDVAQTADSLTRHGHSVSPEEIGGSVAYDPWGTAVRVVARSESSG